MSETRSKWYSSDWIKVLGGAVAGVTFLYAFGSGLYSNLDTINDNRTAIAAMNESIKSLAESVQGLVTVQDRTLDRIDAHFNRADIHQTVGDTFNEREKWWTDKERAVLREISIAVSAHEAGGRPHTQTKEYLDSHEKRLSSFDERIKTLEVQSAETKLTLAGLAVRVSELSSKVESSNRKAQGE